MRETWVRSLGWEDPLEKRKDTHSSLLAWRIPWTKHSMGSQRVGHDWVTFTHSLNDSPKALCCFQHPGQLFQETQPAGMAFCSLKSLISCLRQRALAREVRLSLFPMMCLPFLLLTFSSRNIAQRPHTSIFLKLWCVPVYCPFFCSIGWGKFKIITSF